MHPERLHVDQAFIDSFKRVDHDSGQRKFRELIDANNPQGMDYDFYSGAYSVKRTVGNPQQTRGETGSALMISLNSAKDVSGLCMA